MPVVNKKDFPENYDVLEAWDELFLLLEFLNKDIKKAVNKGNKQAGIRSRRGLKFAKMIIEDMVIGIFKEVEKKKMAKPPHGNKTGAGVLAMLQKRGAKIPEELLAKARQK